MEVRVPAPAGEFDSIFIAGLLDAFHAAHQKAFGYDYRGKQKVEVVNFCVSGFGLIDRPQLPKLPAGAADSARPRTMRRAFFGGRFVETLVYDRNELPAGARLDGPAVIEEFGSTTVVFAGQQLTVDPHGIMVIRRVSPAVLTDGDAEVRK
jgi:N-methylhydantoinase A